MYSLIRVGIRMSRGSRLRLCPLFILIWTLITIFILYQYNGYWISNKRFDQIIQLIPGQKTAHKFNLNQWLTKYPKVEPFRKCCTAGQSGVPAFNTTTDSWSEYRVGHWGNHHKSQNEELVDPNQKCEYIVIGDSITFYWKTNQDVFDANFNTDHNGVIYAYGGDIISDIGWRLKHGDGFKNMKQCLLNHPLPRKSIVLLIGTNDLGHAVPYDVALRDYDVLLNQFAEFLEDINKEQRVVLNVVAIFPRGDKEKPCPGQCNHWNATNSMFKSINFVNEYLESYIGRQDNMRFIDCNRDLLQQVGSVQWTNLDGDSHQFTTGYLNTTIFPDRLHLSAHGHSQSPPMGYEKWAKCLKRYLK